jgi:hypothetical protein
MAVCKGPDELLFVLAGMMEERGGFVDCSSIRETGKRRERSKNPTICKISTAASQQKKISGVIASRRGFRDNALFSHAGAQYWTSLS